MRNWLSFAISVVLLTGIVSAAPGVFTLSTEAPGNVPSSNLYFAKDFNANHRYQGNIIFTYEDTDGDFDGQDFSTGASPFDLWANTTTTGGGAAGSLALNFNSAGGDNIVMLSSTSGTNTYTFLIEASSMPGTTYKTLFVGADVTGNGFPDYYTTNYAYVLKAQSLADVYITAPVDVDNEVNYVGYGEYDISAGNVSSTDISSNFPGIGSNVILELYSVDFMGTATTLGDTYANSTFLSTNTVSATTISATADFSSSGNRKNFIVPYGYDVAGNEYQGDASVQIGGSAAWVTLGRFGDLVGGNALVGDITFSGNWVSDTSGNYLTAGNVFDLYFYATDYYGKRISSANLAGDVSFTTTASSNSYGDTYSSNTSIDAGAQIDFTASANGTVVYEDLVIMYRQESFTITPTIAGGGLFAKESPRITVVHNSINDVIFALSNDITSNSGNGVTTLTPILTNATAGESYSLTVAAVDAYNNITVTPDFGGAGQYAISGNFNAGYADGYTPFGSTALSYPETYAGNLLGFSGNSGVLSGASATLYRAESNTIILSEVTPIPAGYGSNGNTSNDNLQLTVSANAAVVVFFDDDGDHTNGLLASSNTHGSGNYQAAGNSFTLYAVIADRYGNPYTSGQDDVISIMPYTDASSNVYTNAYRNDASVVTATNTSVGGNLQFSNLRVDHATPTSGGNTAYYPFTAFGFKVISTGNMTDESLSPAIQVSANASTNVYFTNSFGIPHSESDVTSGGFVSGAAAGNQLHFYGGVGDEFGNIDLASSNTLIVETTSFSNAPDGTSAPSDESRAASSGLSGNITITPVKMETVASANLVLSGSGNTIVELSGSFAVNHGNPAIIDFVDSSGNYSSGNVFASGNVAGNAFTLYVGALDTYRNTVDEYSTGTPVVSANTSSANLYSPLGYAATSNVNTWSNGFASVNLTIFDADTASVIDVTLSPLTTTASPSFDIGPNVGESLVFVDDNLLTNNTFSGNAYGESDNIVKGTTALQAGQTTYLNAAFADRYGNIVTEADSATLRAGTADPGSSPSGQGASYGTNVFLSNIANIDLVLYGATSTAVQVAAYSGNATYSNNVSFTVTAGSAGNVRFVTSTGNSSKLSPATESGASSPIGTAVPDVPLDDIYVSIVDAWDNPVTSGLSGNVVVSGNADFNTADVTGGNIIIGLSGGNVDANGRVYFNPSLDAKKVVIESLASGSNTILDVEADAMGLSGNSNVFFLGDSVPPSVTVTYPNGGEELYPGTFNVGWTANDTNLTGTGNVTVSLSLDGGATWSENLTTTGNNAVSVFAWTVSANQATTKARIRVQVYDDTGNVGEDISDANFSISSSAKVISYAVGDAESNTVSVFFREGVYDNTGAGLDAADFNPGTVTVGSATHTAGESTATLTLGATLGSDNVNLANIAPVSGNVSKNSDGSSAYTAGSVIASVNIHQLHVEPLGITQTTASSSQNVMGMRLVGWDDDTGTSGNSYTLKQINVTITQIGGLITTSDFASASTDSSASGIGLYDGNGTPLTLDSAPSIAIGSSFGLAYSGNLPVDPITGAANFNFTLGIKTSSTISDAAGDSFTVSVDSIEIIDTETVDNIQKIYVPHGTLTTDPIVADTTAYSTPTITVTDPVNANNVATQTIVVNGEAGANVQINYYNTNSDNLVSTISSTNVLSGLGVVSGNFVVDLSNFSGNTSGASANISFSVNVHLLDDVGNSSGVATSTFTYDLVPPASGNISTGAILSSNVSSATLSLSELETSANVYSVVLTDITGNTTTLTSAFTPSSGNHTITGADLSSLADGNVLYQLSLTDENGNQVSNIHSGNVSKDSTAPVVSLITISSSGNFTDLMFSFTSNDSAGDINYVITDSAGTKISSNVLAVTGSANRVLTGFVDGTVTVSANSIDTNGNLGTTASNTTTLDTTGPSTPSLVSPVSSAVALATPTFTWTVDSDVSTYYLEVRDNSNALITYEAISGTNSYLAYTSSSNYSSQGNLAVGDYSWKLRGVDTFGNYSLFSTGTFSVESPDAPIIIAPTDRQAVTDTPNYRWSSIDEAVSYQFTVEIDSNGNGSYSVLSMSDNTTTGTNLISGNTLSDGIYRWRVQSVDQFGHESAYSDYAEFSVNIPMLQYVVGNIDSNKLKVVFNKPVYGNDNDTGAVVKGQLDVAGLGGASSVTHTAGDAFMTVLTAQTMSSNASNAAGINNATLAASSTNPIYGEGGAEASSANVTIRQVAAADNVTTEDGLTFGGSAVELMNFSIGGWTSANVELKAINFTITPIAGSVTDSDLSGLSLVGPNGSITTSVNTNIDLVGTSQTLTLSSPVAVDTSAVTSPNFSLQVTPSSTTSTDGVAKVFKVELESVVLDIDNVESERLVSGDEETSNVILSSVSLAVTDEDSSGIYTTDELITVTASNAASTSVASFSWAQTSGEAVTIQNGTTSAMSFQASGNGVYGFELTYTRGAYVIVEPVTITIVTKPQEEALEDLISDASNLQTAAEFDEALEIFAGFTTSTLSANQSLQLVSAAKGLVDQLVAKKDTYTPSQAQLDNLVTVVDRSVVTSRGLDTTGLNNAVAILTNFASLPVTSSQTQIGFKIFNELTSIATGNSLTLSSSTFNSVVGKLGNAANQAIKKSGDKTVNIDSSSSIKFYSTRMNSGESSTASLSTGSDKLVTVTVSSAALAELSVPSGNTVMLSTTIVQDTTSAANLASKVYSIDVFETDGDTTAPVTVSGLTNKIEIKIKIDSYDASQGYEVRFRSSGASAFTTDADYTISISSTGEVTFTTAHLTEFAVFESDTGATSTSGGGGGGCLLK